MISKYCCKCNKSLVGLYQNTRHKSNKQLTLRAFYCKHCNIIYKPNEVCIKEITFRKKVTT